MATLTEDSTRRRGKTAPSTKEVAAWVRDRIRRGVFVPGQRLVEADIIAQSGASRSRVREALQRLEAENLVSIEAFRGASVKRIGPDELREIYRTRMVLEGLAAAECAAYAAPELKERLQDIQCKLDRWKEDGGQQRFAKLNSEWHELIIEGAGNRYLAQFLSRLSVPIYRLLFSSFYTDQRIDGANVDHNRITDAIVEGRVDDAEQAMRQHIGSGLAAVAEISAQFVD